MFDSDYSVISNQVQTDDPHLNISRSILSAFYSPSLFL